MHATEAFEIAVALRDRAAEALITDIHGKVEGRDPTEVAWSGRFLNDILEEFERLRTLLPKPDNKVDVYGSAVDLGWQAYPDAAENWFEVAADPGFNRMLSTEWGLKDTSFPVAALQPGVHFGA
ncbi:hypothetical protein ACS3QZ_01250 [Shimia sp. W99]